MPEAPEVARIVHFIRKHLVGKTISKITAQNDENVFGKVGTSAAEIEKALTGKKIVSAGQQGKYFWMAMSSPPHPLMHFGMAGWLKIKDQHTYYYKNSKGEDEAWPPKYCKFLFETKEEPKMEAAFVDLRRFARVRLVDCEASEIRNVPPLSENGPDPIQDPEKFTEQWLIEKCRSKKVPIKAMLLDQANMSGIGNWVGDEIMYNAKIHPEQYANTLSDAQIRQIHKSTIYVLKTAIDVNAESERFPEEWLFKHRWSKGKKDAPQKLPNGEKIVFLTVGGRTSAVVPSVQKKTGPVAKEMDEALSDRDTKAPKGKKRKVKAEEEEEDEDEEEEETKSTNKKTKAAPAKEPTKAKKTKSTAAKVEETPATNGTDISKKRGRPAASKPSEKEEEKEEKKSVAPSAAKAKSVKKEAVKESAAANEGRRRSGRLGRA